MAQQVTTIIEMTDDLDGSKAHHTLRFTVDGREYEIDLSNKNANAFHNALKPYLNNARKARTNRSGTTTASPGVPISPRSAPGPTQAATKSPTAGASPLQ